MKPTEAASSFGGVVDADKPTTRLPSRPMKINSQLDNKENVRKAGGFGVKLAIQRNNKNYDAKKYNGVFELDNGCNVNQSEFSQ